MFWNIDDELGLGPQEVAATWRRDDVLSSTSVLVRGDHIFESHDLGSGEYVTVDPAAVAAAAVGLIAPRVYVDHTWNDSHPQDVSTPCDLTILVGGWRAQTDREREQIAEYRSGIFQRRRRAADAEAHAARLEQAAARARQDANRMRR